ncbi:hypothetical protein FB446DRAFT_749790 [Lentinula raphanica]|nr:hypothetical protein FB446DRAFT_749790 [Lentinula raphanica]KAJ3819526.1 hypothetical protein F5880DRAFT_1090672 [Lentinula raphanica]
MSSHKLELADYSSFAVLLRNGGRFESPAQRKELQDAIKKSTERDIPSIQHEMQQLLSKLCELEMTKKDVQATVSKFERILKPTPVERLPTEILIEIFLILRDTAEGHITAITKGLWPVTHVSREWRNIAISLPKLWSYITIGVVEKPAKNQLQLLKTALARSGSNPLHIQAFFSWAISDESDLNGYYGSRADVTSSDSSIPPWPSEHQLSEALIKAVVQYSDRWVTARIHVLYPEYLRPIYRRLSSLEKLTFGGYLDDYPLLFSVAPKLRDVEFFNSDSSTLQLPWTQFVRFHESQWNPRPDLLPRYLSILRQYPQLEDFGTEYEEFREGLLPPPFTHHKLKALSCSDHRLMCCLTLPALQTLALKASWMRSCPSETIPVARELMNRSRCASSLRVLRLGAIVLNRNVLDLLESTKGLTELNFTFERWKTSNDAFMKRLIQRMNTCRKLKKSGGQVLLPRLESFTIDIEAIGSHEWFTCDIQFIDEAYVDMVEARWKSFGNGISRLQVVKFEGYTPATLNGLTDTCLQKMKKMRDEGLEVYIATMDINSTNEDRKEKTYVK